MWKNGIQTKTASFLLFCNLNPIGSSNTFTASRILTDKPWPMMRHDPQRTGRSPRLGAQKNEPKWKFKTGRRVFSSPAIGSDGTIYVGSDDKHLYAI